MTVRDGELSTPTEASPLQPVHEIAEHVERARMELMEAAKIADAERLPAIHLQVTEIRSEANHLLAELASWKGES